MVRKWETAPNRTQITCLAGNQKKPRMTTLFGMNATVTFFCQPLTLWGGVLHSSIVGSIDQSRFKSVSTWYAEERQHFCSSHLLSEMHWMILTTSGKFYIPTSVWADSRISSRLGRPPERNGFCVSVFFFSVAKSKPLFVGPFPYFKLHSCRKRQKIGSRHAAMMMDRKTQDKTNKKDFPQKANLSPTEAIQSVQNVYSGIYSYDLYPFATW